MKAQQLVVAAVVSLWLCSCGGSDGSGSEPAGIVPASAYMYFEADLDPDGEQEKAVRTVLAALPGVGAPEQRLQEQFNAYAQRRYGRQAAEFKRDIEPWLGDRVASFALVPRSGTDPDRAPSGLIVSTRDREKARHWLFVASRRRAETERTFRGVRYLWMGGRERMAYGIVDGFVVAAEEPAFKAVVARGRGQALSDRRQFARALDARRDDRLGLVWYDTHRLFDTLARRSGGGYLQRALPALRRVVPDDPFVLTVRAKNKRLVVEGEVPAGKGGVFTAIFDEGSALMDQLPKDALAVVGQPNFGSYVRKLLSLSQAGAGGYAGLRRELKRRGLDLERDLLGWMTDAAVFLRRDRDGTLGGALVVQSGDPNPVYDGTARLERFLANAGVPGREVRLPGSGLAFAIYDRSLRKPIYIAEAGKRLVVAYGRDSASAALAVGGLGGEPSYEAARAKLGLDWGPAAYVDVPRLLRVLGREAVGEAQPYLAALKYVIVGGRQDGERLRSHAELVVR